MAIKYAEIFEAFPPEFRLPISRLVDALKEEFGVGKEDFAELKGIVRDLAAVQQRTEARVDRLAHAIEELAAAQQRTEVRLEELATAQQRTEARVEELAAAQQRTDLHVEKLTRAVDELAQTQRMLTVQIGGLGARWGLQTEEVFRQGMKAILQEVGFTTERFLAYDEAGEVFGRPDQVELEVVVKDGKLITVEIKSSLDRTHTHFFDRKVAFYASKTGRHVDRKLVVTPYAEERAKELALHLGVEICTDITTL
jgi:hypothetical protein